MWHCCRKLKSVSRPQEEILRTDIKRITPELIQAKRRVGQRMVAIYLGVYTLFVGLHVFSPALPAAPCAGVSLGLIGGVVMMIFAVVMALAYHLLCTRAEKRLLQTPEST
jgi:uncharacterized membrane protein (DUF485 family)